MLGNHNSKTGFPRLARPPRGQRGGGGGGGVCVGGAQRPVTFLTHFRIPSSTSPSLPRAGREGSGASNSPARSPRLPSPSRRPRRGPSHVTWARKHLLAASAPGGAPPAAAAKPPAGRGGSPGRSTRGTALRAREAVGVACPEA